MNSMLSLLCGLMLIGSFTAFQSCNRTDSQAAESAGIEVPATVSPNGLEITFPPGSSQLEQIRTDTIRQTELQLGTTVPAHIAVSVVHSEFGASNLDLFETQDLAQVHSDFIKSSSALERSSKQLDRVRDLQGHKVVAEKELLDAENEYVQAQAELAEKESRLRAAGIDPMALGKAQSGSVWVLADIPEGQLQSIQRGARVEFACHSFPGEQWAGKVISTGGVVDPATRTLKVCAVLQNQRGTLRPGMFGTVSFTESLKSLLIVPRSAVVNVQGKTFVFRQSGRSFQRDEIQVGTETRDGYVVMRGLRPHDVIAAGGVILLKQLSFGY
jgi:membrane fusion protein, heavy metal efflux system